MLSDSFLREEIVDGELGGGKREMQVVSNAEQRRRIVVTDESGGYRWV